MCLLLVETKDAIEPLSKENFDTAHTANPDGFGIAWVAKSGAVRSTKFARGDEYAAYLNARKKHRPDTPIVMHWRWATHGTVIPSLCHPFPVCKGKAALFHNGVLPLDVKGVRTSDTSAFAALYRESQLDFVFGDYWATENTKWMGDRNKVVLLGPDGILRICNEAAGAWEKGRWHSNTCLLRPPVVWYETTAPTPRCGRYKIRYCKKCYWPKDVCRCGFNPHTLADYYTLAQTQQDWDGLTEREWLAQKDRQDSGIIC